MEKLMKQSKRLLDFLDHNKVPKQKPLLDLGAKATQDYNHKPTVTAVVVGGRRAGKSQLVGHLMFDQDKTLKSPVVVDDGSEHVTSNLALIKHADNFSLRLCPLDEATQNAIKKHVEKRNETIQDVSKHTMFPEVATPTAILDFVAAVDLPSPYQELLNLDLIRRFKMLGGDADRWSKQEQYDFINTCYQVLAKSPAFMSLGMFFVLEISAPWLPVGIKLWDTPGLGDGRFTPLIQHAMMQSDVIIPYNKGAPISDSTIVTILELLAKADVKRLQTHPPTLLLFERLGDNELIKHRATWAGEPPSDEALPQHYCSNIRRAHYHEEVLVSAEYHEASRINNIDGLSELFNDLRKTLMVRADTCKAREVAINNPTLAVLHDRELHQDLLHRANFRHVNVWVHACACFFFQARNLAGAKSKEVCVHVVMSSG
jgi:hypothetical protein